MIDAEHRLARLVASCDLYVHAGDQETFGFSVLEAMACGTPVVVSASGGLGELVHEAGLRVPRPLAHLWAETIRASEGSMSQLRRDALQRARANDWRLIIEQLASRYARLLSRPGVHQTARWEAPTEPGAWTTPSASPALLMTERVFRVPPRHEAGAPSNSAPLGVQLNDGPPGKR